MSNVLTSASLAAAATTTTSAFPFDLTGVVVATITNGGTVPNIQPYVQLQLSTDNSNWTTVDQRLAGAVPSQPYFFAFQLMDYVYASSTFAGGYTGFLGINSAIAVPLYYRLVFTGNDSQAVTISATSSTSVYRLVVPIAGVAATTGGGIWSWTPPQGGNVIILQSTFLLTTNSTGAANINLGIAAAATTSNSSLIAATAVGSGAPKIIDSTTTTSGVAQIMTNGQFLTLTGSATTVGMVGELATSMIFP